MTLTARSWLAAFVSALALSTGGCGGAPEVDSVVLIVVDTLRADHLGMYGYHRPTTPRLDEWARSGIVFERAFSTSPWTLPAFGSLFTGEVPSRHRAGIFERQPPHGEKGEKSFLRLETSIPTLAEELKGHGLVTGAVINNAFLGPRFGVDRGFDSYDFDPGSQVRIRRADAAVDAALTWLDSQGEARFFLTLHLFDPHIRYDPPPPYRGRFSSGLPQTDAPRPTELRDIRRHVRAGEPFDIEYLEALYDEEILFVDTELGRLLDELERRGISRRALIVLTSDHGEEFLEHGRFEHGHSVVNEVLHVPLVMWVPGGEAGRSDWPVSLIDLKPTILDAVGAVSVSPGPGRSLLQPPAADEPKSRLLIAERTLYGPERRAAIRWPYKATFRPAAGDSALYDLETDFLEMIDLVAERPELVRRLAAQIDVVVRGAEALATSEEAELDTATLEALRSLGYIQ